MLIAGESRGEGEQVRGVLTGSAEDQLAGPRAPDPLGPCEMGCHSSKVSEVVVESQKPGGHPEGGEPKVEPGTEAADATNTSMKQGAPTLKS